MSSNENKKLAFLLGRVESSTLEIQKALDSEFFEDAEHVMHAFIENSAEAYDYADETEDVLNLTTGELYEMQLRVFLDGWEPGHAVRRN
jgi:hypothetical protein